MSIVKCLFILSIISKTYVSTIIVSVLQWRKQSCHLILCLAHWKGRQMVRGGVWMASTIIFNTKPRLEGEWLTTDWSL